MCESRRFWSDLHHEEGKCQHIGLSDYYIGAWGVGVGANADFLAELSTIMYQGDH